MDNARTEHTTPRVPRAHGARPAPWRAARQTAFALGTALAIAGSAAAFSATAAEERQAESAARGNNHQAPAPPRPAGAATPSSGGFRPGEAPHTQAAPGGGHFDAGHGGPGGGHFDAGHPGPGGVHAGAQAHYAFHGRDVRQFSPQDRTAWQGGAWHHEYHNGRYGYWWFAGGSWYFYDQPVYPYPVVVSDTVYVDVDPGYADVDPGVVEDAPPPQPVAPPPGYWYYCDNPPGYYPYISNCATPFRTVPAQPY